MDDIRRERGRSKSKSDLSAVEAMWSKKVNEKHFEDAMALKANKESVANAIHRKANKVDVKMMLERKFDVKEAREL